MVALQTNIKLQKSGCQGDRQHGNAVLCRDRTVSLKSPVPGC